MFTCLSYCDRGFVNCEQKLIYSIVVPLLTLLKYPPGENQFFIFKPECLNIIHIDLNLSQTAVVLHLGKNMRQMLSLYAGSILHCGSIFDWAGFPIEALLLRKATQIFAG